jgi:anti-sigma-K factor RskA
MQGWRKIAAGLAAMAVIALIIAILVMNAARMFR